MPPTIGRCGLLAPTSTAGSQHPAARTTGASDLRVGDASVYVERVESLRGLLQLHEREIRNCDAWTHRHLRGHPGYEAIQALRGAGRCVRRRDR